MVGRIGNPSYPVAKSMNTALLRAEPEAISFSFRLPPALILGVGKYA